MRAREARRQRRRVVGDHQIARLEQRRERGARQMPHPPPSTPRAASLADPCPGPSAAIMAAPAGAASDRAHDLRRGLLRPAEARAIGVGKRLRVQRRVHIARIDREETDALVACLLRPDRAQMAKRRLACAVRAPPGIGVHRRVARNIDHDRAASLAGRSGKRAEQCLGQAERAQQVDGERLFQLLAFRIGEQGQRRGPKARGVVDQHVEPAEIARDLQRDRVDVVLPPDVADNAASAGFIGDPCHRPGAARDERDAGASVRQAPDERKPEPGGPAGDGDTKALEIFIVRHGAALFSAARAPSYKFK